MTFEIHWKDCYNDCNFHYIINLDYFIKNRSVNDFKSLVKIILVSKDLDKLTELSDQMIKIRMYLYENKQVSKWKKDYDHLQKVRERYD